MCQKTAVFVLPAGARNLPAGARNLPRNLPAEVVAAIAARTLLSHAPGVRMTVVKLTPSK